MKISFTQPAKKISLLLILFVAVLQQAYSQSGQVCFASSTIPDIVNAKSTWTVNASNQTVTIRTTLSKTFVDNTYGTSIIGWPGSHKFSDLTGSDKLQLALYDIGGTKRLEFAMDYLSANAAAASGYSSLGVSGGDGSMITGSASNVLSVTTSLDRNFNAFNYVLTTNSPVTNNLYAPNATYPNWIYEVWYEVTVKQSAFPGGFGEPIITKVHASPSKTGKNEEVVVEVPCPVLTAVAVGQNVGCGTTCSGSIDLTITNGKLPYTIVWGDGPTTEDRANLCPGTYSVTVTDADGIVVTTQATISGPPAICSDEICFESPTIPAIVNAKINWVINPNQTVTIRTTFAKTFVDNTYGTNAIGWPSGHTFSNLTGSDKLQLALYDGSNTKKLEFAMDYISAKAVPSGYGSLGVSGGDGSMILGNPGDILSVVTSLDKNFNTYGYIQTTNSPATDINYTPNPASPNWIYDVWYEVTVKLSAFGAAGFGSALIASVHASPSKTGNNTEIVLPGPCPVLTAVAVGQNVGCGTTCTGTINLTITNGKQPYNIVWADGPTTEDRTNLCPGTYNVTVTDDNGTIATAQAVISGPPGNCTGQVCFASPTIPNIVSAKINWIINPNQTITIRTTFAKTFVDNTYGTNAVGWPGGHTFSNLTGSDKLQLALYDGSNTKKLEFAMDYISAKSVPSGYGSLGVTGGDGSMILGNAADILSVVTSLDKNFNTYGYIQTVNSPLTDANYTPNPASPNWIYEVWYEATINMSAFGPTGFGTPLIASVHASPSKTGNNTEIVLPVPCPAASIGNYVWFDNNKNGVQDNGETGVPGVTVKLYKCIDNSLMNTLVTDANGLYLFTNLEPGDYYIIFDKNTLPAGYIFTGKDLGGDENKDSDADIVTGKTICETLVDQENNLTYDAGIYKPCDISVTDGHTDAKCFNGTDGTVTITFSGGTAPYQINFNSGGFINQTSPKIYTGLVAGLYTWILKDATGCILEGAETVGQPTLLTAIDSHVDTKCFGSADGTVTITFSGGTAPYMISFDGGLFVAQTSAKTYTGLAAGNHTWVIKDANDCNIGGSEDVGQPQSITTTDAHTDAKCFGSSDGTVTITFNGGTAPYLVNFNGAGLLAQVSPKTYSNLPAGTYTWIVQDANGCIQSGSETVGQPPVLNATDAHVDTKCFGSSDGTVTITFSGGTAPYLVNFNGTGLLAQVSPKTYSNLPAGTYTWIVQDANGCIQSGSETVGQPPVITATDSHTDAKCFGSSDGTVTITFNGGTAPYLINFNGTGLLAQVSPKTYSNLPAGTYTWIVQDANGCIKEGSETLGQPPIIKANDTHVDAKCFGSSDGTVTITFNGGTAPYLINFNGTGLLAQVSPKTYSNLPAGTYSWIVQDANGCINEGSETIGQPPVITATDAHTDAKCFGSSDGTVTITFNGGTAPYLINFNGTGLLAQVSPKTYSNLPAGTYTWIVQDANGCIKEGSETVGQPPVLNATDAHVDAKCFGSSDGTVTITFNGGTAPYLINFNGTGLLVQVSPKTYSNLPAGTYTWIVQDANGCIQSGSETVGQPPLLNASDAHADAKCFGSSDGTVTITFNGGTAPYLINFNGAGLSAQVSPKTYSNLPAGTYTWIVQDANGCIQSGSETVGQPPVIIATDSHVDAKCFGSADGTVTITFSGGTAPYLINFNGTGLLAQVSPKTYSNLPAGTYTWIVQDANGCIQSGSETVGQPPVIIATDSHVDAKCFGSADGIVTITFSGGTAPYRISFDGGPFVAQTSPKTYSGLAAGNHTWVIKDANDCLKEGSEDVGQPTVITASDSHVDAKCFGNVDGSVTVTFSGGTAPYRISFDGGPFIAQTSPKTYSGLAAGNHTWVIKDANDCIKEGSEDVGQPTLITATDSHVDAKCFGSADGSVTITFSGGTAPYRISFDGGLFIAQTSPKTYSGLAAGNHTWVIKDANDCIKEGSEDVGQPPVLSALGAHANPSCNAATGSVTITFSGGTAPYLVSFNGGNFIAQTSPKTYSGLAAGTYTWIVKDANDCQQEGSETIIPASTLIATDAHVDAKCFGSADGSVTITFSGGTAPYKINFNGGGPMIQTSSKTYSGLAAGTYTWIVEDAAGCTQSGSETIGQPPVLEATDGHLNITCSGGNNGSVTLTFSGGTAPYRISFDGGLFIAQTSPKTYPGLSAGNHTWVIKDANDCIKQGSEDVGQPSPFFASSTKNDVTCTGANDGCINAVGIGGTSPYSYTLNAVTNNTGIFCQLAAGNYIITVTDASGCTTTTSQNITEPNGNNCNNNTIVVDQSVTIDFNTAIPTYTGDADLLPFFSYSKAGATADTWKAIFTLGANKLIIKNGVTITTVKVNGYAPGIQITGDCSMEIENNGHIIVSSTNKTAGDIDVQMNGNILVNGEVRNEVTGTLGLPGHITIISRSGTFTEGITGLIQILGIDPGANTITIQTCGLACDGNDINISGLVKSYAHAHAGDLTMNRPNINVIALNGAVNIFANTAEPLYDEFSSAGGLYDIYGGLLSWVRDNANPGNIKVQAKKDVTVKGHGTDPTGTVRSSFGALAAISTASSSPGGTIDVRSLEGKITGTDRAFDVGGKNLLSTNFANIKLYAKGDIQLSRPGANNNFNPIINSSSPASNGKGGINELRSFTGAILIGANAVVTANVAGGTAAQQGINLLTSCTGVTISGTVIPADINLADNIGVCIPSAPAAIFEGCPTIGNLRTVNNAANIVTTFPNTKLKVNSGNIFTVYPNPTRGLITLRHTSPTSLRTEVRVTDASGKRTLSDHIFSSFIGTNYYQLDLSSYANGVYIILVKNNNIEEKIKIIKQ